MENLIISGRSTTRRNSNFSFAMETGEYASAQSPPRDFRIQPSEAYSRTSISLDPAVLHTAIPLGRFLPASEDAPARPLWVGRSSETQLHVVAFSWIAQVQSAVVAQ